ncbi:MAG: DUF6174 domain-containing protein [Acidimicrobiales bacterium]|jgi:hypothetical protein|nr:DUF6174 domain-containing protein [Acidimicrobiales bacterium]
MRLRLATWVRVGAVVAAMALAACGSSSDEADDATVAGTEASTSTTTGTVTTDTPPGTDRATNEDGVPLTTPAQVTEARQRWEASGVTSYTWEVAQRGFFYPTTLEIVVSDGAVVDATVVADGDEPTEPAEDLAVTVDDVFDQLEASLAGGTGTYATFDPTYGHPVLAQTTFQLTDAGATYEVLSFAPA